MESRKHSRTISPDLSADLEALVFDQVRDRLLKAVGAGGMWTLQFRSKSDTDALFGETISEYIARDVANQIAKIALESEVTLESEVALESEVDAVANAKAGVDAGSEADAGVAVTEADTADAQVPAEAMVEVTVDDDVIPTPAEQVGSESGKLEAIPDELVVEPAQHREHRLFRARKAA